MRKAALLALMPFAIVLSAPAFAADDAATLTGMEAKWTDAFLKHDAAYVSSITADDWSGFDPDGKRETRASMLAHVKDPKAVTKAAHNHGVEVKLFGDLAIVQGYETETSSYGPKNTSGTYYWTDVFQKQGGQWKAIRSQTARAKA